MNRILLVDDDEIFRKALHKNLRNIGFEVIPAENGKHAVEILKNETFDLVISDIRMPEMDGIELTKHIKANYKLPVILITGFAEILETQEAHKLGADEFIAKPFEKIDIEQAIENCRRPLDQPKEEETLYCRLSIEDFTCGREIQFNIFVKVSDKKFVKIAHKGQDISIDRVRSYRSKGIDFLYLRNEDFRVYVGFNLKLTNAIRGKETIDKEKRLNLLRHTGEVLLEQIKIEGVNSQLFDGSVTFVQTTVETVTEDIDVLNLLDLLNRHVDHLYGHSVAVSLIGVMLARSVDWKLPTNNFKVAMGGLLHDVGQKELDRHFLSKPRFNWSVEDVKNYESHCSRGVQILSQIKSVSDDVLQIVKEHHEDCLSMGFPSKVKKAMIHPMARLIAVADDFCHRVMKTPDSPGMSPTIAIEQMSAHRGDRLDPQFFNALKEMFQYPITK